MLSWFPLCAACRPKPEPESHEADLDEVQVEDDQQGAITKQPSAIDMASLVALVRMPSISGIAKEPEEEATPATAAKEETQICPVSGLSTLEGVCPFAKPKTARKTKDEVKRKLKLKLDFQWEEEHNSFVRVQVRPRLTEHFKTLDLPDTASKEEIRVQYHRLARLHHPDKNSDVEAATARFQKVEKAYQALKDTDGELGFAWDDHPEQQRVMSGEETVRTLAKLGMEAWDHHHLEALQLRHMVRLCPEVRMLIKKQETGIALSYRAEVWVDALCIDPSSGSEHVVKLYRREVDPAAKEHYHFAPEDFKEENEREI